MTARRTIRSIQTLALAAGLGLTALTFPTSAAAAANTACPPDWLGTTTNAEPQISASGRFVVFTGYGPDGEIGDRVIFLRDRLRGRTTVVSDPDQVKFNFLPSISADGNRVSYLSMGPENLGNEATIWVYDRRTGARTNEGVSFTQTVPALNADGRRLVYEQLEDGNTNRVSIFTRDVDTDKVRLISANLSGKPANHTSVEPEISANGRLVLFRSEATDLTPDSTNVGNNLAIFVRALKARKTSVIPDRNGDVSAVYQYNAHLSPEGRYVVYTDPTRVWRYDRRTGRTVAASAVHTKKYFPSSADVGSGGRQVLLTVTGGLLVRTIKTKHEVLVDRRPDGTRDPAGNVGYPGAMTPNGRYVVFYSGATGLDGSEKARGPLNIYVRDLKTSTTDLVSSSDAGGACVSG